MICYDIILKMVLLMVLLVTPIILFTFLTRMSDKLEVEVNENSSLLKKICYLLVAWTDEGIVPWVFTKKEKFRNVYNIVLAKVLKYAFIVISIICIFVDVFILLGVVCIFACDTYNVKTFEKYKTNYEKIEEPNKTDCEKADGINEAIKDAYFYDTNDFELIDTDTMWAKFCNRINKKAEEVIND